MRTATGDPVILIFAAAGVHVLAAGGWRRRLFRIAGGAVFTAVTLAVVGLGVDHAIAPALGTALAVAAFALAVTAGMAAMTAWALIVRAERVHRHDGSRPDIAVEGVAWARSSRHDDGVHVAVGMSDGSSHEFIASGATGMQLEYRFGELLGANQPTLAADPTSDDTSQP